MCIRDSRNGFIMRAGPAHNDFVTPAVVSAASSDYRQNLANTLTLIGQLRNDSAHSESNRKIMQGWLDKYVPLCVDAVKGLKPVWGLQNNGELKFESVDAEAKNRFRDILAEIQLELPKGVSL